jgi:Gpi18-like mannosyltransferase
MFKFWHAKNNTTPMLLSRKYIAISAVAAIVVLALAMRVSVLHVISNDMRYFLLPWYEHFAKFGLHGIATIDSNYNVPYLYFIWLATQLPFAPIDSIKLITLTFEIAFAVLVYFIGKEYYPKSTYIPLILAIGSFFTPTLFVQGALWGQCDIIYTTFLVASWWMITKGKQGLAWILFGTALAFKLQAIFFLPYIAYTWFVSSRVKKPLLSKVNLSVLYPLIPLAVIFIAALPAVTLGRSAASIFGVYIGQVTDPGTTTSLGSATSVFQLFVRMNDPSILYLAKPAIFFTGALVIAILATYILYVKRDTFKDRFVLPLLLLTATPYFLPFMHDRYFFAAEIFAVLFAVLTRKLFLVAIAVLLQATALPLYATYLWHTNFWPVSLLALIQLSIIGTLLYQLFVTTGRMRMKS